MKNTTKFLGIVAAVILTLSFTTLTSEGWLTNFDKAKAEAASKKKNILLSFSGSDWCGNCIRLDKTLFQSEEFKAFGKESFVLLNADFPMKKKNKLPKEQADHNDKLAEKYNKKGEFPLVLVLDINGKVLGKMTHPQESAKGYLSSLKKFVN